MGRSPFRRVVRWFVSPPPGRRQEKVPRWWVHCPVCDRPLVGPYHPGGHGTTLLRGGAISLPPNRAELVAKCPVHGRRPYNDPDRKPASDWIADDEASP
jgi:hypothetical protein